MAIDDAAATAWTERAFVLLVRGRVIAAARTPGAPSNCLLWALAQEAAHGGTVRLTRSRWGPWLHASWEDADGQRWCFEPDEAKADIARRMPTDHPPTLFHGKGIRCDGHDFSEDSHSP